jgi:hypothetical protein
MWPLPPLYSSQGEGSGYNCGKKVKEKKTKEKNKKVARVWPSSSSSGMSSLPCSVETQWVSSFWPLRPLVQRVVAMLRHVCFCTIEDERCVCPDLRREGVR